MPSAEGADIDPKGTAGTFAAVSRYTAPSDPGDGPTSPRRPLSVRIGVWVLLVGVVALVFVDLLAALL